MFERIGGYIHLPMFQFLLAGLLCLLFSAPSWPQGSRATVRLDGDALFQVGAETRAEARARADQIERRLNRALGTPQAIPPAEVLPQAGELQLALQIGLR